ncbi:hypothetical protein [Pseudomonas pseudonitroreducens]|uniref:hypothetical protein n=1 Tax=Pseudomonas pseudonitroreducens TaxID=2892326 RepID=UPI001F3446A3|nr:hypothetical protein [Pseudomonas pseudonitroreducens]
MSRRIHQKVCHCCSTFFYSRSILTKYCSKKCSNKAFRNKSEPTQAQLKKLFEQQQGIEASQDVEQDQVAA